MRAYNSINLTQFKAVDVKNISQADQDFMNFYLFDDVDGPKESNRISAKKAPEPTKPAKVQPEAAEEAGEGKEPWEMTKEENFNIE